MVVQAGPAPVLAAAPGREREGRGEEGEEGEGKGGKRECHGMSLYAYAHSGCERHVKECTLRCQTLYVFMSVLVCVYVSARASVYNIYIIFL